MKVPFVTEAVCLAVTDELVRVGEPYLTKAIEALSIEQPHLITTLNCFVNKFVHIHGILAAESLFRLLILQYKLIETQFDVNDLEEQAKL